VGNVSRENYERIRKGVTKQEVEEMLGPFTNSYTGRIPPGQNWFEFVTWERGSLDIEVWFSIDMRSGERYGAAYKGLKRKEGMVLKVLDRLDLRPSCGFSLEGQWLD
jgi:hypothetical protein